MEKLLTQQDLAERWQVDVSTIKNWRKDGIITPVKGIPAIRFTEQHIAELEGVQLNKVSPITVKKLERELEHTKKENENLRQIISSIFVEIGKVYALESNNSINA